LSTDSETHWGTSGRDDAFNRRRRATRLAGGPRKDVPRSVGDPTDRGKLMKKRDFGLFHVSATMLEAIVSNSFD
jgi:hypothetical protein